MKDMMNEIFEFMVNLFQAYIVIHTVTECLECKFSGFQSKIYFSLTTLILFLDISLLNRIYVFEGFAIVISMVIIFIYSILCLRGKWIKKLFWSIFIMILIMGITAIILNGLGIILGYSYLSIIKERGFVRYTSVITIQLIIFYTTRSIILQKRFDSSVLVKSGKWITILIIPLISIFAMTILLEVSIHVQKKISISIQSYTVYAMFGIMIMNLIVYFLYFKLHKEQELVNRYELLQKLYDEQVKNIKDSKKLYQDIRKMRHDLKNHASLLLMMLSDKKYNQAQKYLENICDADLFKAEHKVFCDNDAVNYIINSKIEICENKNIKIYCLISKEIRGITDIELCIMLGNLLDNAIEGCSGVEYPEVRLEIKMKDNFLSIQVQNTIDKSVLNKNPMLITSKRDKKNHGLGIMSIKDIVTSKNGILDFKEDSGFFNCYILLDVIN